MAYYRSDKYLPKLVMTKITGTLIRRFGEKCKLVCVFLIEYDRQHFHELRHIHFSSSFITQGQFWPSGIVVACVCLDIRVSACVCINHLFVRALTRNPFKLGSPNLDQGCKTPWLRSLLFWGVIYQTFKVKLDLKVKIYHILTLSAP